MRIRYREEQMARLRFDFTWACAAAILSAPLPGFAQDPSTSPGQVSPNKFVRIVTLGAIPHLAAELFKSLLDLKIMRVAYKGTGPG